MWIAGPTLAIGYLNMPEKTAERFVQNPFATAAGRHGERMYDTGDRCRYLPSGSIEVIGRCDYMVKVRGKLGEPGLKDIEEARGGRLPQSLSISCFHVYVRVSAGLTWSCLPCLVLVLFLLPVSRSSSTFRL